MWARPFLPQRGAHRLGVALSRRGLSLVETLIVLGIIALLLGLIVPAIQRVRGQADAVLCMARLNQIGVALHHYHGDHDGFPPGCTAPDPKEPFPYMNWHARLLPYLEKEQMWRDATAAFAQDSFFRNNPPHTGVSAVMPIFLCPAEERKTVDYERLSVGLTSYLGAGGTNQATKDGVLYFGSKVRLGDILDGPSNTLMVGERPSSFDGRYGWWYGGWGFARNGAGDSYLGAREFNSTPASPCPLGPYAYGPGRWDNPCAMFHFWSLHPGGAHFLFAGGNVQILRHSADAILPALATRAGREPATLED